MEIELREFKQLIKSGTYIVDFWTDDKGVHKDLESVAKELGLKKAYHVKIQSSDNKILLDYYKLTYVPSLIVFRAGKELSRIVGYKQEK